MKFDYNGLIELKKIIKEYDKKVADADRKIGEAFQGDTNTWHDNAQFDYANIEHHGVTAMRAKLSEVLKTAELVEAHGDPEKIDIGANVTLYDYEFDEELKVILSGGYASKELEDGSQIITLNSPLGAAIWGAKKDQDVEYFVNNNKILVKVVEFSNPTNESADADGEKTN